MALANDEGPIRSVVGKTIQSAVAALDVSGYGFVHLTFTDGTSLTVEELGQCGEIRYWIGEDA